VVLVDYFTTVLILGSLLAFVGGIIGYKLVSSRGSTVDSKSFTSRLGYLQDENMELKKYLKSLKGSLAQTKQGVTLDEGTEINEDAFDSTIQSLITKYSSMAPKNMQFLLRDPAIVNYLISEAKKHPEQTKEVLKHFIGKNGDASTNTNEQDSEQAGLELAAQGA